MLHPLESHTDPPAFGLFSSVWARGAQAGVAIVFGNLVNKNAGTSALQPGYSGKVGGTDNQKVDQR